MLLEGGPSDLTRDLDLEASTLSRSFTRPASCRRLDMGEFREGRAEESKLSQVRVLLSPPDPPPALGARTPLAVTPTHARTSRSSARRRATTSLPPQPPAGETTDDEQAAARQAVQRAATTAGGKQVRRLVAERRRNWSDPKKERRPTSPGNTATNDYLMNKRAAGTNYLADIDIGDPAAHQAVQRPAAGCARCLSPAGRQVRRRVPERWRTWSVPRMELRPTSAGTTTTADPAALEDQASPPARRVGPPPPPRASSIPEVSSIGLHSCQVAALF